MEGLEISIIAKSQVFAPDLVCRVDAEYFAKQNLEALREIKSRPFRRLGDLAYITDGIHASIQFAEGSGIRVISAKHPKRNFFDLGNCEEIAEKQHALNPRTSLKIGDVIISTVGTIGNAAVVTPEVLPANSDRHVGIIRCNAELLPEFLSTFLLSKYGRVQTIREATGNVQLNLFISKLGDLVIPSLTANFQRSVASTVLAGQQSFRDAAAALADAEETLTAALGLLDRVPPEPLTYTVNAAEALDAGRIDAEYWHPAKAGYLLALLELPGHPLGFHFRAVREMFDPADAPSDLLVRNFDVTHALQPVLDDTTPPTRAAEIGSAKKRFVPGDLAVSRLRHYLREIALVRTTPDVPAVGSSEFIVLRPQPAGKLSVETLLVFLRSHPVQTILKWSQDGSHHPRFDDNDLLNIPVPDAVCDAAPTIGGMINAVLHARQRARELLQTAQRAVEIAIEQSEADALAFLAERTQ